MALRLFLLPLQSPFGNNSSYTSTAEPTSPVTSEPNNSTSIWPFPFPVSNAPLLANFEMIAYEFAVQALTLYEDSVASNTKRQIEMLGLLVGTVFSFSNTGNFIV